MSEEDLQFDFNGCTIHTVTDMRFVSHHVGDLNTCDQDSDMRACKRLAVRFPIAAVAVWSRSGVLRFGEGA
ncbi:MAG: hypothetical protein WBZ37_11910 [Mycobacterium sp.]